MEVTETPQEFAMLALSRLVESPLNPRRTFTPKGMEELIASVRIDGVHTPLLVRPINGHFEVLAGARRFRAAQAAKVETVPVRIREMDDSKALELMVLENLQREDVHPLEEGEGYRNLLETAQYSMDKLAERLGKSTSYIYQRLKLADLTPAVKKAFLSEQITSGHAILIARLQPHDQAIALKATIGNEEAWGDGGLSVRALGEYIQSEFHLDLSRAPFRKDDATLVPSAGACLDCPKRTGANTSLFPEIKKGDYCTDGTCFKAKIDAFVKLKEAELPDTAVKLSEGYQKVTGRADVLTADAYVELRGKNDGCDYVQSGLVVNGLHRGETKKVCTTRDCKKH